jgi:mono/diheme cytochrome c family protein
LVLPRAIALVGDGAIVGAPPELAYWRDTDGDGVADLKVVLAADYGVKIDPARMYLANPERAPNSLLHAFDNWLYSASYTRKFRFRNGAWETGATLFRGQWGLSQDDHGRFFYNSNSDQLRVDLIFSDYLLRNPHFPRLDGVNVNAAVDQYVWPARVTPGLNRGYRPEMFRNYRLKEFTAACAPWVYRGDLLGGCYGDVFVAEPSGNLVRRNILTEGNGTLRAENAYTQTEFIVSTDERFRPVNFATGPDGALYIVDMYRGVIQHRIQLTPYLARQSLERGLVSPRQLGRIYRVVPADRSVERATNMPALTGAEWVARLAHPNAWWRETAQRILVETAAREHVPAIRHLLRSNVLPAGKVHALWTLEGLDSLDHESVLTALGEPSPIVCAAGIRLAERYIKQDGGTEMISRITALARLSPRAVQLQAALTLSGLGDEGTDMLLADTARMHPKHKYLRDAFFSGIAGRELSLLERLAGASTWSASDEEANMILSGLAQGVFASRDGTAIQRVLILAAEEAKRAVQRAQGLLEAGVAAFKGSKRPVAFDRIPNGWMKLREDGRFEAQLGKLAVHLVWPGSEGVARMAAAEPLARDQQATFAAGKVLFGSVCAPCHQPHGGGLEGIAPPLLDSEWVLGPPERLVRIILHGLRGQIVVAGRTYTGDMPAFNGFDDTQISAVLTYLRREWGHDAAAVGPEFVASVRAATQDRGDAWTSRELTQLR